ncbi:tRNA pseudouridine(55) synthase TruB [Corynebacterium choanae]|uniref:tRNA pseudouridine synthase B n=1 Tax=Corynebacterium choanae TaxID=1862358 RepID=A0A3G6J7R2_9CORY|nr:tRNA pseudouridine(55) synthase TruB [Corynebacterium choanae]AZA13813.1 tRNA pseudouridine synthase B [Corynebacterium choanae]
MTAASNTRPFPLADSGVIVIDKPLHITSHDVVAAVRRAMGTRKVGHAGTLDPLASGVLVVGVQRGTKALAHLVGLSKTYEATVCFGATSTTEDAGGVITPTADASSLTLSDLAAVAPQFRGDILQRPSSVSAIKINGKRAHQRVREGEEVTIPPRPVTIDQLEFTSDPTYRGATMEIAMRVHCSSGTYIRALARDLGEAVGTGTYLTDLRRTAVGPFTVAQSIDLDTLAAEPHLTHSIDEALQAVYPTLHVDDSEYAALAQGKWLEPRGLVGVHAAVNRDGQVVALVKESGKRLATTFVARPSTL